MITHGTFHLNDERLCCDDLSIHNRTVCMVHVRNPYIPSDWWHLHEACIVYAEGSLFVILSSLQLH